MATDEMLEGQPDDRRLLIHGPERVLERDALDAVHNNGYKLSYLQRWLEEDTITQGPDGPEINEGSTAMRYFDQVKEHNLNRTQKSEDGEPDVHNSRFLANEVASEALSELRFYGNGHTDTPHLERQLTLAILNGRQAGVRRSHAGSNVGVAGTDHATVPRRHDGNELQRSPERKCTDA